MKKRVNVGGSDEKKGERIMKSKLAAGAACGRARAEEAHRRQVDSLPGVSDEKKGERIMKSKLVAGAACGIVGCVVLALVIGVTAEAEERGFFYKGYDTTENPFQNKTTEYWVSSDGDDANPGTKGQPWKTLGHARKAINGGDAVNILPGLYYFGCGFGPAGPNEDVKTLWRAVDQTFKTGRVVITANEMFAPPSWGHDDNVSIQGLWIGGEYGIRVGGSYTGRNCEVINCTFFNGVSFAGGPAYNWLFQNNRIVYGGSGTHGHSMYMAGGIRHDLPWNSRNLRVLGNVVIEGEGYAIHCWHSPVSATIAGNFSSGNYWSLVLQGSNHSSHHNVLWKPRGNEGGGDEGQYFSAWLPAPLRRFDHMVFCSSHPVWQVSMPPMRAEQPITDIYLLYDVTIEGVPKEEYTLLNGKKWTGEIESPTSRGGHKALPDPGKIVVKPDFFPQADQDIDGTVASIGEYFRERTPLQVSQEENPEKLEKLFDLIEVQYHTTVHDYAAFPPMMQDKEDGTYGAH